MKSREFSFILVRAYGVYLLLGCVSAFISMGYLIGPRDGFRGLSIGSYLNSYLALSLVSIVVNVAVALFLIRKTPIVASWLSPQEADNSGSAPDLLPVALGVMGPAFAVAGMKRVISIDLTLYLAPQDPMTHRRSLPAHSDRPDLKAAAFEVLEGLIMVLVGGAFLPA